ncbi:hypothetical protein BDY24DRAFT_388114 [Mrakia frigida]|uniref:zinc finger MYND domain-containing protein n=1 Tax=Mrakia frigida TaxID=29902 RepID=UPI003FCC1054
MDGHTPLRFAQILRLSSGIDARPADIVGVQEFCASRRVAEIITGSNNIKTINEINAFWAEIASTYLPCLLRTWTRNGQDDLRGDELHIYYSYADYLTQALGQPSGARLVRELPYECVAAYERTLQTLETLFHKEKNTRLELVLGDHNNKPIVHSLLILLDVLTFTLAVHLSSISDLPPLPNSTRLKLRSLWSEVRQGWPLSQRGAIEKQTPTLMHMLKESYRPELERSINHRYGTNWFTCEVVRLVKEEGSKAGPCTKMEEGEEMSTCGRCKSVRYCSRKHQAVDWKEHKRVCFEQRW